MKLFPLVLLGPLSSFSVLIAKPTIRTTSSMTMKLGFGLWRSRRPSVLGLVGGIASGKSTVSRILEEECGFKIIDADKLGHESYLPGTRCFDNLVKEFGKGIISSEGTIDRRALGEVVFGSPSNMERLQRIVWPEIKLLAEERISKMGEEGVESVVLEAAVMLEAGWDDLCEEVWTVQVPQDVARKRLMQRNGFSEEQANKRLASQKITNEERASRAAVVLTNEGTEEELIKKVKHSWKERSLFLRRGKRRPSFAIAAMTGALLTAALAAVLIRRGRTLR